jgi:bacterioferritin-associated ferredoxin
MVDVLVDNLVGGTAAFEGADQSAKLKLMGVHVASFGAYDEAQVENSTVYTFGSEDSYRKIVLRDGKSRIAGAIAVGEWKNLDRVRDMIEQCRPVSFWDIRRFRSTGNLWLKSKTPPVSEWPREALICSCMRVDRGKLTEALRAGCASVEQLSARTGDGTMCGSCKPLLAELLGGIASPDSVSDEGVLPSPISLIASPSDSNETDVALAPAPLRVKAKARSVTSATPMPSPHEGIAFRFSEQALSGESYTAETIEIARSACETAQRRERAARLPLQPISLPGNASLASGRIAQPIGRVVEERGLRILLMASLLGFFAALATGALGAISFSNPSGAIRLGALPTGDTWRQATGYTMLTLGALSLLLAARKRFKWFAVGDVSLFRAIHASLGASIVLVLILHAGFHLGRHLNEALTIDFLTLAGLGSVAGGVTALSHWWSPVTARNQRRIWNAIHLVLAWPLPVLVVVHVLCVYFY